MKRQRIAFACVSCAALLLVLAAGSAPGAGVADLADQAGQKLLPALRATDLLVETGQETALEASLGTGLRKEGLEGKRIQFLLGEQILGEAKTDGAGTAILKWKAPEKAADYCIRARLNPDDQPQEKIADADIFVAARDKDTKLVVVDLDKTVVQSGFFSVLVGVAKPMPGAAVVLGRLAKDGTVVYLTHRPDFLAPTSKRWLAENGFPPGPVLTSTMTTLLAGSGPYKTARLAAVKKVFPNVMAGIGDKMSDAKVYAENGVRPILILLPDWSEDDPKKFEKLADDLAALPDSVQVVTNWQQVAAVCFEKAVFLKRDMEKRLRDTAAELRRKGKD
jgi:hypothetical protein